MSDAASAAGCAFVPDGDEPLAGSYFVSTYPPFSCWTEAGAADFVRALDREPAAGTPLGIYLHVPFCVERCQYCYYLSHDDRAGEIDRYVDAIVDEAARLAKRPAVAGRRPHFVYFGGGTPSLLSNARLGRLLAGLRRSFDWSDAAEVSFECAPRSVTASKLRLLRDAGVTRISMGVQQMDDAVLARNGRVHLVADVERAFRDIRDVGFDVVNLDLIVGLVGETEASWLASLERMLALGPDSITTYQLEIPLNTPLWRALEDGTVEPPASWEVKRARLRLGVARMATAGYTTRSAYAMVRDPVRHRFVYQDAQYHGADLVGIGVSAFSHVGGVNHQNRASLRSWLEHADRGELPLWRGHALSDRERMVREFVLQLKLGGVSRAYFAEKFAVDVTRAFGEPLAQAVDAGWLQVTDARVDVTPEGLLRVDRLIPAFYLPEHRGLRYS